VSSIPKKEFVESLARGLEVITSFDAVNAAMTIAQVAERTGLTRPTAHRILLTLEDLGYVANTRHGFMLTPKVVDLGMAYVSSRGIQRIAQPHMETLVAATDQSVSLAQLSGSDIVYIVRVEVPKIISVGVTTGGRLPAMGTSMGQVLMSELDESQLALTLDTPSLSRFTPRKRYENDEIEAILADIRVRGWAHNDEVLHFGVRSIAAPVRNSAGTIVASLGMAVHASEVTSEQLTSFHLPLLLNASKKITADWQQFDRLPNVQMAMSPDGIEPYLPTSGY
jgi:IclR family pca regulon transcriptional regulator